MREPARGGFSLTAVQICQATYALHVALVQSASSLSVVVLSLSLVVFMVVEHAIDKDPE